MSQENIGMVVKFHWPFLVEKDVLSLSDIFNPSWKYDPERSRVLKKTDPLRASMQSAILGTG